MADEGPNSPGTMTTDSAVGTKDWNQPDHAKTSNNIRAESPLDPDEQSYYLKATNFGFSIPSGATIDGIKVEIEKGATREDGITKDSVVSLVKGGTVQGDNKANADFWPEIDAYVSHGADNDLWSLTLSAADINNANFGMVVSAYEFFSEHTIARIDHIRITVYYTEAAGTNIQVNVDDAFKEVSAVKVNVDDVWKNVTSAKVNVDDTWKTIF